MTREEMVRRAKVREQRRRVLMIRRIVVSVIVAIILIPLIYSCYSHIRMKRLKQDISVLEQQLKDSENNQKNLQKQLDKIEEQLKKKENQLKKQAEATKDYPEQPNVYLTFDDGPSQNTDYILNTLSKYNVRATFFCIAREGEKNAARYQRIVQEGHTLAMHSYSHDYSAIYKNLKAFKQDVTEISDFLYDVTDVRPEFYRFPGGSSNTVSKVSMSKCIKYLNRSGLTYFDWNAQNDDAVGEDYTPSQLVSHSMESIRRTGDNAVLLMHDEGTKTATAKSLPKLIRMLKNENYDLLPITEDTQLIQHVQYNSVG